MRSCRWALVFAILSPCFGGEIVYLNSGFSLEIDSHIQENQTLTCRTSTGTLEFQLSDVARIEELPAAPAAGAIPRPESVAKQDDPLVRAALEQGLPPEFIRSVAKIESGLKQDVVSPKGAIGLMQLMPGTAAALGVEPSRAEENAQGGAKYLRQLLLRYHNDSALALAAYNAGPGAVDKYRGVPPYAETQHYVLKVLREYERQQKLQASSLASAAQPSAAASGK